MIRRALPMVLLAGLSAAAAHRPVSPRPEIHAMAMKKLTPVLVVDRVEPAAAWWRERLGLEQQFEVPHEGAVGFVSLTSGGVEIMYQSRASVAADLPSLAEGAHRTVLFIEVDDLDAVERAMEGVEIVSPRRTTFYGMHEIAVREPGGNVVVFAQPSEPQ
jgi:uncharacterized glyoxalase superfamily protein PhnB